MRRYILLVCLFLTVSLIARQSDPFTFSVVTTGLQNPWEIAWGPDAHLWVTERTGKRIVRVNPADGSKTTVAAIDEVYQSHGQDGLLGLALHPMESYVYVAYTYDAAPGAATQRRGKIRRYTYNASANALQSPLDVIAGLPAGNDHIGFRLAFGPDQKLYLSIGDQGANWLQNYCTPNRAQELPTAGEIRKQDYTKYQGKMLRLNLDGSVPADNPTLGGARSHIYSYGHRNPQGLAFGSNGRLYSSEHGPDTDDEFNLVESGKNYGWPNVAGYNDDRVYVFADWSHPKGVACSTLKFSQTEAPPTVPQTKESAWKHPDFQPPLRTFFTAAPDYDIRTQGSATIAPGGMDIYPANGPVAEWGDSALLLSLKLGTVYRVKLDTDVEPTQHFKTTNRYRDIAIHPNGRTLYIATDSQGASTDASGLPTRGLANPGAIIAFTYN